MMRTHRMAANAKMTARDKSKGIGRTGARSAASCVRGSCAGTPARRGQLRIAGLMFSPCFSDRAGAFHELDVVQRFSPGFFCEPCTERSPQPRGQLLRLTVNIQL